MCIRDSAETWAPSIPAQRSRLGRRAEAPPGQSRGYLTPSAEGIMSRLAPPTIMLTAAILLAGCATPDVPTMPNADLGAQARIPGAANFGALVERFPPDFEISWDPARNVTWTLGLVNPISDLCDPTADVQSDHSGSFLSVTTPNGARHIRLVTGGQVTFALYEGTPDSADLCTAAVLATGKAVSTTNDNDQFLSLS